MKKRIELLIPVFNDWDSACALLEQLDVSLSHAGLPAAVTFVDDGSLRTLNGSDLRQVFTSIDTVRVIRLVANLGHQRAIAVGLSWLSRQDGSEPVCILDADGEDDPAHVADLFEYLSRNPDCSVVFAQRGKRTESLFVRTLYYGYKVLHRMLTGFTVDIGNFSVLRRDALLSLVTGSALWNHYPAAVLQSRLEIRKLRKDRGSRYSGRSKMTLHNLIIHGLSAVSVFSEQFGVRLLAVTGLLTTVLFILGVAISITSGLSQDMWIMFFALGIVLPIQYGFMILAFVIFTLSSRNSYSFIPLRDYHVFIYSIKRLYPAGENNEHIEAAG